MPRGGGADGCHGCQTDGQTDLPCGQADRLDVDPARLAVSVRSAGRLAEGGLGWLGAGQRRGGEPRKKGGERDRYERWAELDTVLRGAPGLLCRAVPRRAAPRRAVLLLPCCTCRRWGGQGQTRHYVSACGAGGGGQRRRSARASRRGPPVWARSMQAPPRRTGRLCCASVGPVWVSSGGQNTPSVRPRACREGWASDLAA